MVPTTTDGANAQTGPRFEGGEASHRRASSRSFGVCVAIVLVVGAVAFVVRTEPVPHSPAPLQIAARVPTAVRTQMTPRTRDAAVEKRLDEPRPSSRAASESSLIRVNAPSLGATGKILRAEVSARHFKKS